VLSTFAAIPQMTDIRKRIESGLNQLSPYLLKKTLQALDLDETSALEKAELIQLLMNEILEAGIQGLFNRLQRQTLKAALVKFNISVPPDSELEESQIQLEQIFLQQTLQEAFAQCGDDLLSLFCADLKIVPQHMAIELEEEVLLTGLEWVLESQTVTILKNYAKTFGIAKTISIFCRNSLR
jgi:hypothetical protein